MNFLKRAIIRIKRSLGKNLILLLIVLILGTLISGAIAVEGAINNTEANLRRGMRPIVSFDLDEEVIRREAEASGEERFDLMTIDMIREMGDLPYVAHYDYSLFSEFWAEGILDAHGNSITMGHDGEEIPGGWFTVRGTSIADPLDMREGFIELVAGNLFTESQLTQESQFFPALISAEVAARNDFNIGSTFTVERIVYRPIMDGDWDRERTEADIFAQIVHEFEIIGLFERTPNEEHDPYRMSQLDNRIYVPNLAAEVIQRFEVETEMEVAAEYWGQTESPFGENPQVFQTVMILENIDDLENFRTAAEAIIPDMWYVTDLTGAFSEITNSMNMLQDIADWILIIAIGATLLILSLLITLFLKDRRHEMGVYLALGEKKFKIIIQIVTEVTLISIVSISLALFIGHFVSANLSQTMIRNELAASNHDDWHSGWGGINALEEMGLTDVRLSADEMMAAFDVSLEVGTIGLFYAVGLGAVILSTLLPVLYIVTLKPKKVLL